MSALPQSAEPCFAPLGEADFARVLPIEQMAYSHPWTQGNFRDALVAGYHLEGLWQDGELLGYFVAMRGVDEVHLLNLTVAPDHQRQGHARRMLERLQIWTTAQGLRCLHGPDIDAHAHHHMAVPAGAGGFHQYAGQFAVLPPQIVGPLQADVGV